MRVRLIKDTLTSSLKRVQKQLDQVPKKTFDYWVSITPIRTGNARRRTRLVGRTIDARYPYAERLDNGWSRQAPEGMTRPTERFLRALLRKIRK